VGDWVAMQDLQARGRRKTLWLRVEAYSLDPCDPQIRLSNYLYQVETWYHRPSHPEEGWKWFEKIPERQVPRYLREGLFVEPAQLSTWYQLSKWQILERSYERPEAEIYLIMSREEPGSSGSPILLRHELAPISFTWKQIGQRRRRTLTLVAPTYVPPLPGQWGGGERSICADGTIRQGDACLALYASGGQGESLRTALARLGAMSSGTRKEP
jgi:hypothetical protein